MKSAKTFLILIFSLIFFFPANAATGGDLDLKTAPEKSRLEAEVDGYIQPFIEAGGFSGALLMARGGKMLLAKGFGMANYELDVPNTPQTRFQIASISKTFTAAAILLLEERGKLKLADPLTRFWPGYPNGDKITVHHLLAHTSGIPNVNDFPDYDAKSKFPHTLEDIISWFKDMPLGFAPGEKYAYSNSNYNLLAFIIEKASGQKYEEFLKKTIFEPLGMNDTGDGGHPEIILENRASGYSPAGAGGIENAPVINWSTKRGNGSLFSTVEDLYKWDRALYGEKIIKKDSLEKLFKEHTPGVGYGWFIGKHLNRRVLYFNGRSPGFTSYLDRFIDDDACIIILSNNYAPVPHTIISDIAAILFGEKYNKPESLKPVPVKSEDLELLAGQYRFGKDFYRPEAAVSIEKKDGYLTMKWNETFQSSLMALSPTVFLDRYFWAKISFEKNARGKVTRFIWSNSQNYSAEKIR